MKIAIITSGTKGSSAVCLPRLAQSQKVNLEYVILATQGPYTSRKKKLLRNLKKVRKIGLFGALNGIRLRSWTPEFKDDLNELCKNHKIKLFKTTRLNSKKTRDIIKANPVDLIVSLGNSYISKKIFTLPTKGMINLHTERLPQYQNAQSVIWPIYNMETDTGLTIHRINQGIDTGAILKQRIVPIQFHNSLEDTVKATKEIVFQYVPIDILDVVENFDTYATSEQKQGVGSIYTTPSIWQFFRMVRNNKRLKKRSKPTI